MRETLTHGSVGGAPGNRCFYPDEGRELPGRQKEHGYGLANLESYSYIFFVTLKANTSR